MMNVTRKQLQKIEHAWNIGESLKYPTKGKQLIVCFPLSNPQYDFPFAVITNKGEKSTDGFSLFQLEFKHSL